MTPGLFADVRSGSGFPIVFLHGFGGHHGIWDGVRTELGDVSSIAYDLPGHGRSLGWRDAMLGRRAAAALLDDLTERLAGPFHLVGHSLGGALAILMALAQSAHVRSLTLLASGGVGKEINGPLLRAFAAARTASELDSALRPMTGSDFDYPPAALAALAQIRALPGQSDVLGELVVKIAAGNQQGVIPVEALATLEMPVTVLWGDDDQVLPPRHADALPSAFTVHRLSGAGHMLPEERPSQIAAILRQLLET